MSDQWATHRARRRPRSRKRSPEPAHPGSRRGCASCARDRADQRRKAIDHALALIRRRQQHDAAARHDAPAIERRADIPAAYAGQIKRQLDILAHGGDGASMVACDAFSTPETDAHSDTDSASAAPKPGPCAKAGLTINQHIQNRPCTLGAGLLYGDGQSRSDNASTGSPLSSQSCSNTRSRPMTDSKKAVDQANNIIPLAASIEPNRRHAWLICPSP